MKFLVYRIDENGYYVEPMEATDETTLTDDLVTIAPPNGLYRAKWTGTEWVEDMTQKEIDELNKPTAEQEIASLKSELEQTDYKIIKCSEYQLANLELPYDIQILHIERQALRDRINELELTLVSDT